MCVSNKTTIYCDEGMHMNAAVELQDYSYLKDGDCIRAPLSVIDPLPCGNVRKKRNPVAFEALRNAIRMANGVTQGVTVRVNPDDPARLQLLAGYGRFEVSTLEGFDDIPAVVKVVDDKEAEAIMLSENLDREDLSIADEIVAAQRFISHYDGDYEAAAAQLGWSAKRLRGRLLLNNCTDVVLEALRNGDIVLGHAEILSAFVPKLQDGTLEKIIDEAWSVEYLKDRAGKANRWLKNAIFDKDDCASCQHNSDFQAELFDNSVGKAKCSNLVCYKAKTDEALEARKTEIEEEYGVVLLAIEKPAVDRNTVSAEVVGSEQFANGCTGCVSKVVILQDGINADAGSTQLDQCIDKDCFRSLKTKFAESKVTSKAPSGKSKSAANKPTEGKVKTGDESVTTPPATQKTPGTVLEANKAILRSVGADLLASDQHLMNVYSLASLIQHAGLTSIKESITNAIGFALPPSFSQQIVALQALSPDALAVALITCYTALLDHGGTDDQSIVISALARNEKGLEAAVAAWVPTKDILKNYLKGGLEVIGNQSGLSEFYDAKHGDGAFNKEVKKGKAQLIEALLIEGFDWSGYAPDDYRACLK